MENISIALQLMVVGMVTVFLILLLIIQLSKGLIAFVNRVIPEEKPAQPATVSAPPAPDVTTQKILQEAVAQITGGKGRITEIRKI